MGGIHDLGRRQPNGQPYAGKMAGIRHGKSSFSALGTRLGMRGQYATGILFRPLPSLLYVLP